jgi:hypothetical protein
VSTRELSVRITGDPKSLSRAFRQVDKDMGGMEKASMRLRRGLGALGKAAAVAGAAAAAGFAVGVVKATKAASDLEESVNKARETFEAAGPAMETWASTAATSLGMSKAAALENAASIGAMLKPMGVAPKRAAEMSREMVKLASDMASFNNEDPTEMLDRIRSGLSGESEPLKRFGAVLSETRVKQHAYKVGIAETGAELTEQQKIQARYSLLLKDTADQQGDFARTADGAANAQRIFRARMEDISATAGRVFLPVFTRALGVANDFLAVVEQRWPQIQAVAVRVFGSVRSAVDPLVNRFRKAWPEISGLVIEHLRAVWRFVQDVFNDVAPIIKSAIDRALPILADMAKGIARTFRQLLPVVRPLLKDLAELVRSVVEMIARFWERWGDDILALVRRVFTLVVRVARPLLDALRGVIKTITGLIEGDWSKVFGGLKDIAVGLLKAVFRAIKGLGGLALSAMKSLGRAIVRGIVSGIKSIAGEIRDAVRDAILDAIPGRGGGGVGRAILGALGPIGAVLDRGGTVPGRRGQAVPIVAHAGEVVLNPSQQRIVGIDRIMGALRATGGIVGGDGAAFASGGLVWPSAARSFMAEARAARYSQELRGRREYMDCSEFATGLAKAFGYKGPVTWTGGAVDNSSPARGDEVIVWGFRGMNRPPRYQHMGIRVDGTWYDFGGSGLDVGDSRWDFLRVPKGLEGFSIDTRAATSGRGAERSGRGAERKLSPRERLAQTIRGAGISSGVKGIVNRVLQAGADVSAAVGARLGTSSARGERAVRAAGRAAARRARAAGKPPDQVAADEQAAERAKQGQLLRADIRRVNAALQRLAKRWAKLRADLKRVGKGGGDPAARRQALNRIRAAMRQNRRERDELIEIRAELIDELKELNEEIAQEQYEENFAGGDGEGPPTEADFAEAALAQAALTPGLEDDLSAARTIEDLARRDYEAALASGDPRRIADAARAYLSARQQRESIEEQIKAINENTEALKDLNRTFGGSVVFGYRGQDYVLRSLAPPSSDRIVGMEV